MSTNRVWGLSNCVLNLFTNDAFVGMSQYHLIPQNMLLNGKTILINVLLLSAPDKRRDLSSIIQFLVFFNCKISLRTYGTTPTYWDLQFWDPNCLLRGGEYLRRHGLLKDLFLQPLYYNERYPNSPFNRCFGKRGDLDAGNSEKGVKFKFGWKSQSWLQIPSL